MFDSKVRMFAPVLLLAFSACGPTEASALAGTRGRIQGKAAVRGVLPKGFTRWVSTGETEGRFETAKTRFVDEKGRSVELIGAVHIGDAGYFAKLQKSFEQYDALLYELVARKGTRPKKGRKSNSVISMLQRGMKNVLDLEFQLDAIDYSAKNFVHADLDPRRFFQKQKEKGESILTIMLRAMLVGMKQQCEGKEATPTVFHILAGFASKDGARYLKFLFAQQLDDMEAMLAAFGGDKGSASVIVGERNAECFRVLDEQLRAGKKKLGIYYGAAHLPDMSDRLRKRGFKPVRTDWTTAWDCTMTDAQRQEAAAIKKRRAERHRRRKARAKK